MFHMDEGTIRNAVITPGANISTLFKYEKHMFITPSQVATPFIKVIKKRKEGIIYSNYITRILVKLMSGFKKQFSKMIVRN